MNKIKAALLPLNGKYYGTEIQLSHPDGYEYTIKLWNNGSYEPSDRELDSICTIEEWRNNTILQHEDKVYYPFGILAKEAVEICDSHFESRETYEIALELINKINNDI